MQGVLQFKVIASITEKIERQLGFRFSAIHNCNQSRLDLKCKLKNKKMAYILLPHSPSDTVLDRGSIKLLDTPSDDDQVTMWNVIKSAFGSPRHKSLSSLIDLFATYRKQVWSGVSSYSIQSMEEEEFYLENATQELDLDGELLHCVKELVCLLPEMFPSGQVVLCTSLESQHVELTRLQMACLNACLLLGVIRPKKAQIFKKWIGFDTSIREWTHKNSQSSSTYLAMFSNYLKLVYKHWRLNPKHEYFDQIIAVKRVKRERSTVVNLMNQFSDIPLCPVDFRTCRMEQVSDCSVSAVFSNKNIGPGSYSTQEEVVFGSYNELLPVSMLCSTMGDEEVIVVKGAQQIFPNLTSQLTFTERRHIVLDSNAEFGTNFPPTCPQMTFLFMDAIPFDTEVHLVESSDECIWREITKAYTAFSYVENENIITGFWGCG